MSHTKHSFSACEANPLQMEKCGGRVGQWQNWGTAVAETGFLGSVTELEMQLEGKLWE